MTCSIASSENSKVDHWPQVNTSDARGGDARSYGFESSPIGTPSSEDVPCRIARAGVSERQEAGKDNAILTHIVYFSKQSFAKLTGVTRDDVLMVRKLDSDYSAIGVGLSFRVLSPIFVSEKVYTAYRLELRV